MQTYHSCQKWFQACFKREIHSRALDAGACGIVAPMINNKEDAQRLVDQCRYMAPWHCQFRARLVEASTISCQLSSSPRLIFRPFCLWVDQLNITPGVNLSPTWWQGSRYAPKGKRSWGPTRALAGDITPEQANEYVKVVWVIEHPFRRQKINSFRCLQW